MSIGRKGATFVRLFFSYILLAAIAVCCLYPALWVVLSSLKPGSALYSPSIIPDKITFVHYMELFQSKSVLFGKWYWNTFKIAVFSMIFGTLLTTLSGYALSRFRFRSRKNILTTLLILGMFPGFMSMIAIFILLFQLGLLDTHAAMILVYTAGAPVGGTFVVKGFFDTIPRSLEEAARIDGASNLTIFTRIIIPLSRPMLTFIGLTTFYGAWVDFIFARLVLRSKEQWTVAVGLWDMVSNFQNSNFTMFAAASVLIAVPITCLFIYLQRFLIDGLTAGASKG
jgi:arabinogalactan oligomer/maltooligosaccharide transport system permease protein